VAPTSNLLVEIAGRCWRVGTHGHDLSIPLQFDAAQPRFFGAPYASSKPLAAGRFTGEVRRGSSCNCATITLTPHCNGTHTECLGHVTHQRMSVRDAAVEPFCPALLISVQPCPAAQSGEGAEPAPRPTDLLITRAALQSALAGQALDDPPALIVRTLPHDSGRMHRDYDDGAAAPYFSSQAMHWIVAHGVRSLIVDLPSIDRSDSAHLTAHRIFWGLPAHSTDAAEATRPRAVITELAYVEPHIADGPYLLNLQVAPFVSDAAPSRPVLLPLLPA